MHEYLGIRVDHELLDTVIEHTVTQEEADNYSVDSGCGPSLGDFRLYWDDLDHEWNESLAIDFVAEYETRFSYTSEGSEVKDHFFERLSRHQREVLKAQKMGVAEVKQKHAEKRVRERRRKRTKTVCH
jgi:hypothetical protein